MIDTIIIIPTMPKKMCIKNEGFYPLILSNYCLGVNLYAPNALAATAATMIRISIILQKEQQVQPQMSQQMLSQVGSCEHYARALLPYQGLLC